MDKRDIPSPPYRRTKGYSKLDRGELIVPEIFTIETISDIGNYKQIDVFPRKIEIPVRRILFDGICPLEEGDVIRAYLRRYDTIMREDHRFLIGDQPLKREFYFARGFLEEETAETIEKLDPSNIERVIVKFECKPFF